MSNQSNFFLRWENWCR